MRKNIFNGREPRHLGILGMKRVFIFGSRRRALACLALAVSVLFVVPLAVFAMNNEAVLYKDPSLRRAKIENQTVESQKANNNANEQAGAKATKGAEAMNTDIKFEATSDSAKETSTSVVVNGQKVPMPANGTLHKEISNGSSNTTVDVKVDNKSETYNSSTSSSTVIIEQHSYSSGDSTTSEGSNSNSRHPMRI